MVAETIFCSTGMVYGQTCTIVIGGGRCDNIISQTLVDHLKLKVYKHDRTFFVKWLMTSDEMQV